MARIGVLLALALAMAAATPAWGKGRKGKRVPAKSESRGKATGTSGSKSHRAKPAEAGVAAQLEQLQELIRAQSKQLAAQQKEIEALQREIGPRAATSRTAATGATGAATATADPAAAATADHPDVSAAKATVAVATATHGTTLIHPPANSPATVSAATPAVKTKGGKTTAAAQLPGKKPEAIELAGGKIRLGFTMYGDWGMYFKTGFGPQFLTQANQPGPGNDYYNSFNVTRTYINFFYSPNDKYTLRFTPNIFRNIGTVPAEKYGRYGAVASTAAGSLTIRIKYAYIDFNKLFAGSPMFGADKLTVGQQTNSLIDWEESLYGYRFTSLVPWNYLSLSSTQAGVQLHGPVKINGKQYLDYAVGAFNSGSFHNREQASEKQVMARLSYYPLGATGRFDGLGFTGFVDYGYANSTPDLPNHSLYRVAALTHYTNKRFGIAGEYDYGKNAFGVGNLFSGSGPADAFGLGPTPYAGLATEAKSILGLGAQQRGFDFFGHLKIPHSRFSLFGLYQYFQPNINVSNDPLDFERIVGGIAYRYDSHLQFALDSQNLIYTHSQFTFHGIPNAVPTNSNALFLSLGLNY